MIILVFSFSAACKYNCPLCLLFFDVYLWPQLTVQPVFPIAGGSSRTSRPVGVAARRALSPRGLGQVPAVGGGGARWSVAPLPTRSDDRDEGQLGAHPRPPLRGTAEVLGLSCRHFGFLLFFAVWFSVRVWMLLLRVRFRWGIFVGRKVWLTYLLEFLELYCWQRVTQHFCLVL